MDVLFLLFRYRYLLILLLSSAIHRLVLYYFYILYTLYIDRQISTYINSQLPINFRNSCRHFRFCDVVHRVFRMLYGLEDFFLLTQFWDVMLFWMGGKKVANSVDVILNIFTYLTHVFLYGLVCFYD